MDPAKLRKVAIFVVSICAATWAAAQSPPRQKMESAQAERMLALLRAAASGSIATRDVDAVLAESGTSLILEQQNIVREVTRDQYRQVLLHIADPAPPVIAPANAGERARRGVDGLVKNVWPSLRWGTTHVELLVKRLAEVRKLDLAAGAVSLAQQFLPEQVDLSPRLFLVMGGRAGAAALSGDRIYFDLLISSYYADTGTLATYPAPEQITEFFAHEIHHLALGRIIERNRAALQMDSQEKLGYEFLSSFVMEGSATYLINARRSEDVLRRDPQFAVYFGRESELFAACQDVLLRILGAGLRGEEYEKAVSPFGGSGWHVLGSVMLAAIDRAGGLAAVMKVLDDPRRLLQAYNESIGKMPAGKFRFDPAIAERITKIGSRRPPRERSQ